MNERGWLKKFWSHFRLIRSLSIEYCSIFRNNTRFASLVNDNLESIVVSQFYTLQRTFLFLKIVNIWFSVNMEIHFVINTVFVLIFVSYSFEMPTLKPITKSTTKSTIKPTTKPIMKPFPKEMLVKKQFYTKQFIFTCNNPFFFFLFLLVDFIIEIYMIHT